VIVTDGGWNVDCFSGSGSESVDLSNVTALYTNQYALTFTWIDYHGGTHTSDKDAATFLSAGNASSSGFAGSGSIAEDSWPDLGQTARLPAMAGELVMVECLS
jgi:hypothetical protein